MSDLTPERVAAAWASLGTGDREKITEFWDENVRFEVPGLHAYSGWYEGLDGFLEFFGNMFRLSGGTMHGENVTVLVNPEAGYSVDVNHITAVRAGAAADSTSPYDTFAVEALHLLRWDNGRIVEGRWAVLGAGAETTALWWSPRDADGARRQVV
ncbi:nuclear transport factor 2 family protein [Streptomyces sp. 1222.5]|uniref:nuclear transport factor 2 family protein n=1 Tax=Streptomyces sp. 1222.5 TaxID=1881026 RepID=UPI003D71ABD8